MKVYISKSNQANMDDLISLRTILKKENHEILEFNGGAYDPGLLLKADQLMILPPMENKIKNLDGKGEVRIGKGNYTEVSRFLEVKENNPVFMFKDGKEYLVTNINRTNEDWKVDYARLIFSI